MPKKKESAFGLWKASRVLRSSSHWKKKRLGEYLVWAAVRSYLFLFPAAISFLMTPLWPVTLLYVHTSVRAGEQAKNRVAQTLPSYSTNPLAEQLLAQKPLSRVMERAPKEGRLSLLCLVSRDHPRWTGVLQRMEVKASLRKVESAVESFELYDQIIDGYDKIDVSRLSSDLFLVSFWQKGILFLPSHLYQSLYEKKRVSSEVVSYTYHLTHAPSSMHFAAGRITLHALASGLTEYGEEDYWEGDFGLLGKIFEGKIWTESLTQLSQSDLALAFLAEAAEKKRSLKRILEESREAIPVNLRDGCKEHSKSAEELVKALAP